MIDYIKEESGSSIDGFELYVTRMARLIFLKRRLEKEHPVSRTEYQLVDMAASHFREKLLAFYGQKNLYEFKNQIKTTIRQALKKRVASQFREESLLAQLMSDVDQFDFLDLFDTLR